MHLRTIALYATWAALAWSVALTGLAAAGNHWVLDRVAGGAYAGASMPVPLRVLYGAMSLVMVGVARLAYLYYVNDATRQQRNLGRFIMLLFIVSTALNAISRSTPERYNAISAAIVVVGIGFLRRRPLRNFVDLRTRS